MGEPRFLNPYVDRVIYYGDLRDALQIKPFKEPGCPSSKPMMLAVGEINQLFEGLHDALNDLYDVLVAGTPNAGPMSGGFRKKLELCRTVVDQRFTYEKRKGKAIRKWLYLCQLASEIRNKVIHGQIVNLHFIGDLGMTRSMFLTPSPAALLKTRTLRSLTEGPYCWNLEHLQGYARAFVGLKGMIMTVREELDGSADPPHPDILDPYKM